MNAKATAILDRLAELGWRASSVARYELEWWADEIWQLESSWSPVGSRAYLTFLIEPQIMRSGHETGDYVWAAMASREKPTGWQTTEESLSISLTRGWEERIPELLEYFSKLRDANT